MRTLVRTALAAVVLVTLSSAPAYAASPTAAAARQGHAMRPMGLCRIWPILCD